MSNSRLKRKRHARLHKPNSPYYDPDAARAHERARVRAMRYKRFIGSTTISWMARFWRFVRAPIDELRKFRANKAREQARKFAVERRMGKSVFEDKNLSQQVYRQRRM